MTSSTAHDRSDNDKSDNPPIERPDPEDPPAGSADELDDDFDPATAPSNPDLVGESPDEVPDP